MVAITASAQIGWIGVGKMGLPICKRLQGAGFQVRALCRNGASESIATTNGFEVARTIGETAEGADVVVSAISDDKALAAITFAEGGLKDSLRREQIYVDMSTVSPEASAQVAEALSPVGCAYLRAPVSGSTATATQGALTALVSGPAEAFGAMAEFLCGLHQEGLPGRLGRRGAIPQALDQRHGRRDVGASGGIVDAGAQGRHGHSDHHGCRVGKRGRLAAHSIQARRHHDRRLHGRLQRFANAEGLSI